jgi:hypothetical protein
MLPMKIPPPDLAQDFIRIHKVITRGFIVAVTRGTEFVQAGFPDQNIQQGFVDYVQSLVSVISAHHLGEDGIVFPALKEVLSSAPYGRLAGDHKKIEAVLHLVKESCSAMVGSNPSAGLGNVVAALTRISALWTPHIEIEQQYFSQAALAGVMYPAEQARVSAAMAKHAQEHASPPFLVLPFVLFNLAGADRAAMAESLPQVVIQQLIPGEWKEHWTSMKPFLLD